MPHNKNFILSLLCFAAMVLVAAWLSRYVSEPLGGTSPEQEADRAYGVRLADTSAGKASNPDEEYLVLNVAPPAGKVVTVTGLRLSGGEHAAQIDFASSLPMQGTLNDDAVLVLTRPASVVVSTGRSPIGVSFRENMCTGLLATFQPFTPPLTPACDTCSETTQATSTYGFAGGEGTYPDYNACVEAHQHEPDFFLPTWRIYLNQEHELWRNDLEVIKLFDHSGKLLDTASY